MKTFIKLLLIFFLGGITGGLIEIGYQLATKGSFVLGGFLYGPFRPIYGYGFLIIYLIGKKINKNPLVVFLVSFLVCSIFEYSVSYIMELMFGRTWWNYDNFYLNINGRICLLVSFCWGLIGLIFIKLIVPVFDKTCEKANENKVCIFIAVLLIIYIFDTVLSNIRQLR